MNDEFMQGYREGVDASDTLQNMSEEELQTYLERSVQLGLIDNAGYWTGRLTSYGGNPTLDDGTTLSY